MHRRFADTKLQMSDRNVGDELYALPGARRIGRGLGRCQRETKWLINTSSSCEIVRLQRLALVQRDKVREDHRFVRWCEPECLDGSHLESAQGSARHDRGPRGSISDQTAG